MSIDPDRVPNPLRRPDPPGWVLPPAKRGAPEGAAGATAGRAWCFGDFVDTDAIVASHHLSSSDPKRWSAHVFAQVRPEFSGGVRPGDVVVAGRRFGTGSSREHAAIALRGTGIRAVLADSFSRNFYRNAFNSALLLLEVPGVRDVVGDGDLVVVDLAAGTVTNRSSGVRCAIQPVPELVLRICQAGGLPAWLAANGNTWTGATDTEPSGSGGA